MSDYYCIFPNLTHGHIHYGLDDLDPKLTILSTIFMEREIEKHLDLTGSKKSDQKFFFLKSPDEDPEAIVVVTTFERGDRAMFFSFAVGEEDRYNVVIPVLPEGTEITPEEVLWTIRMFQLNNDIKKNYEIDLANGNVRANILPSELN